jgi:hypothetical protein
MQFKGKLLNSIVKDSKPGLCLHEGSESFIRNILKFLRKTLDWKFSFKILKKKLIGVISLNYFYENMGDLLLIYKLFQ